MTQHIYTTPLGKQIEIIRPRLTKRLIDILFAVTGIILFSPVLLLVAFLIKLFSKGPILYLDDRLGLGGRPYKMFKFRSMKVDAPPALTKDGKLVVAKRDPRVTPIGRIIRMFRVDELPQLFNVLKGDMSLVGPRAGLVRFEAQYDDLAYKRLRVRPGCTGLGTVAGGRHLSNRSLYQLEARYVEHQSFWLDVLVLLMTPVYVFFGEKLPQVILKKYIYGIDLQKIQGEGAES